MNFRRHTKGMTLVEMLVVIALTSIVVAAIMSSIVAFYNFNAYTIAQSYEVNNARKGMKSLIRDLREMIFADDGTFPLAEMEDYRVAFYSDIDRDNSVEYVVYTLSSTTLEKRIHNATGSPPVYDLNNADETHILSEYVQNEIQVVPIFTYYDDMGAAITSTSTITDVRYIEVELIVNVDPIKEPGRFELRSSAALRNLRDS